jgi:hypothetical protein
VKENFYDFWKIDQWLARKFNFFRMVFKCGKYNYCRTLNHHFSLSGKINHFKIMWQNKALISLENMLQYKFGPTCVTYGKR